MAILYVRIPIIKINVIGNVIEMMRIVKNTFHNHCQCLLLYKLAEHWTSRLGRFYSAGSVTCSAIMLIMIDDWSYNILHTGAYLFTIMPSGI